jgi:DnaK suppressor protein
MDKISQEKYRRRLEEELSDLQAMLARTGQAGRVADEPVPEDMVEKAVNSYNKEFLFRQSDNERSHLFLVQEALSRMKTGDFGLCQSCGKPIERKRLDAVPWAPLCRACQELEEVGEESSPPEG